MRGYYFITDAGLSRKGNEHDVREAIRAGVSVVQYRAKNLSTRAMLDEAARLRRLCKGKALFLVNDRVDVCLASSADGVHLGQEDMPCNQARRILGKKRVIGVTVHTPAQALAAVRDGADYLAVSPVFATSTKADAGAACGTARISEIRGKVDLPLVAIGGITLANAQSVIEAGADCVCAISAVVAAADVGAEIRKFQQFFQKTSRP